MKQQLKKEYESGISGIQLAKKYKKFMETKGGIYYWLHKLGVQIRDERKKYGRIIGIKYGGKTKGSFKKGHPGLNTGRTHFKKGKIYPWSFKKGKLHHNWKGGITPLNKLIRRSKQFANWRNKIFERDNYTCQECGINSHKGLGKTIELHPHHIIPLSHIMQKYQIKSMEDAIKCKDLWDTNNGITYCIDCHFGDPSKN